MVNRFTTAQSTVAMRRWGPAAIVTLAAMAALTALTADAAGQPRPAQPKEATAPREAGEPIMAIVSIKTQQVTFYDAEGWIFRAPVSTGVKERETPAGVFAVIEKDKDTAGFRRRASQHRSGCRGSAAPRRPDGVPLVRMRAFEGRLKRMLNTLPGVLTDTVLCQSILFCWRFQLSAAQAVLSNIYQYRP